MIIPSLDYPPVLLVYEVHCYIAIYFLSLVLSEFNLCILILLTPPMRIRSFFVP